MAVRDGAARRGLARPVGPRVAPALEGLVEPDVLDWLLEGDSAIRWQALRDLTQVGAASIRRERAKVATEGWGARLLAEQRPDGRWRGIYSPKWVSTHYTLLLLRLTGLAPSDEQARRGATLLMDHGVQPDGGIYYTNSTRRPSELCETGMALAICAYFGLQDERLHGMVEHLAAAQLPDGGWNCRWIRGAREHSSFHTTISVLEGLLEYERLFPDRASEARRMQADGREFFLQHHLYRAHRTGKVVDERMTRPHFPPHWHHDFLRGLEYFRDAGAERDRRLQDAIDLLRSQQRRDGRWGPAPSYPGETYFRMEPARQPSRWTTLRALRVLGWSEAGTEPRTR